MKTARFIRAVFFARKKIPGNDQWPVQNSHTGH